MEVDDEYEWMDEAGYKPVDGPLPVSKRQQKKGLGPSAYILVSNSIEALEKNYLAQSPSHSLTDPVLHRERETSIGFPWRPVPEHLVNLPGIGEPLIAGDPPLSQTGQLPHPLGQTSLRKAQWFNLCLMTCG